MRNIFVEGVRSAFIRIIRLIVYIILTLVIIYIIGLFSSKKAYAMTRKESFTPTMDAYTWSGSISDGGSVSKTFTYSTPLQNTEGYNYLLLRFREFSFYSKNDIIGCANYIPSYDSNGKISNITCASTGSYPSEGHYWEGSYTITATIRQDANISNSCYISDNMKGFLICEMPDSASSIEINIRQKGYTTFGFKIDFYARQYFYNEDSTEIINALTGVSIAQQQTTTIIQQQTTIMQDSSTTQSTTQATNTFTIMSNEITQQLSGLDDLTQVVLAPISLFVELATDTCSPLVLSVPFVNYQATLPCMKPVFNQYFSGLYTVFTTAISAIITYWVSVKTLSLIKDILDCDNDRIEVIDL